MKVKRINEEYRQELVKKGIRPNLAEAAATYEVEEVAPATAEETSVEELTTVGEEVVKNLMLYALSVDNIRKEFIKKGINVPDKLVHQFHKGMMDELKNSMGGDIKEILIQE